MALHSSAALRRAGFTLIELIVVLVILAAVATLVLPKLGFVEAQAGNATAAAASGGLVSHLETVKLTTKSYPLGFDSLLEVDDPVNPTTWQVYQDLWSHAAGPTMAFGPRVELEAVVLGTDTPPLSTSLGHAFMRNAAGEYYLFDHVPAPAANPSSSATVRRAFTSWSGARVARVRTTFAPGTYPFPANRLIKAAGYADGVLPAGTHLLAFGVGPNLGTIGETIVAAPRHNEQTAKYYGRYIALFAAFESGKPAVLKAVVDSHGSTIEDNVGAYYAGAPEHK